MRNIAWILGGLAALAFILALVGSLTGFWFMNVSPEAYSRGCTNMALLALLLAVLGHGKQAKV